jgi:hypothetical protein
MKKKRPLLFTTICPIELEYPRPPPDLCDLLENNFKG